MDKALEILLYDEKDIKMGLNSHVAGYLIYGHCSRCSNISNISPKLIWSYIDLLRT
jgi:hypothetical protein